MSPSNLGGAKAIGGLGGLDEDAALRHGTAVHRLLEHLPGYSEDRWDRVAANLPDGDGEGLPVQALEEARRVLTDPEYRFLFGADVMSEVDVTCALDDLGGRRISGAIDKLVVSPGRVLAVDFKTNAIVPRVPSDTPEGLLRQMGAYAAALQAIYPDRSVETAILWTRTPSLMLMPHDIVRDALRRTATS